MDDRVDSTRMEAWRLLLQTHATITDRLERELVEECGLPLSWYDVLVQLDAAPGRRLRMQQLVASLLLSKSGISRLVDRMVDAGYIERQTCPTDRRGAFAVLAPAGRAALQRAAPVHMRGIAEHFARHLSDSEAAALRSALERLLVGVGSRQPCGEPCEQAEDASPVTASAASR